MAISRASFENFPVNLITAVPSVETYENIKKKNIMFLNLPKDTKMFTKLK